MLLKCWGYVLQKYNVPIEGVFDLQEHNLQINHRILYNKPLSLWNCRAHGSVVERVPDKNEVLGSIPSAPTDVAFCHWLVVIRHYEVLNLF